MTTATTSPPSDIGHAVARGGVYALLTGSFAYPTPEGRDRLRQTVVPVVAATRTDDAALDLLLDRALAVQDVG